MTKEEDQKGLQKKYLQLQLLKQYVTAMIEEKGKIETKIAESAVTMHAAESISNVQKGEEFWAPLGSDAYMLSDIVDVKNLLLNVGANVYVQKTIEEANELLQKRRKEYEEVNEKMGAEIAEMVRQIELLERQVQEMAKEIE
ncbi:MAG: prefoldin subunit alpha [Candidatus Aenigmarchaeota archaeon]|nr:prefoldin subunit alpha [Candidatus Aenigmarchaeota archaeon]